MKRKPVIAFLGTDGSGKTTIMNAVLPIFEKRFEGKFLVKHLKPDLLPPLGRYRGIRREPGWVCTTPHGSRPSGFIGSCIRLAYLTADYILGYWFKVRCQIKKAGAIGWVFDRYAYDMLIDPLRFRLKLPDWMIKIALSMIPKPDVVVCLGGDADAIYSRKPETSREEVVRQLSMLNSLQRGDSRMKWVDATETLENTVANVVAIFEEVFR